MMPVGPYPAPGVEAIDLALPVEVTSLPRFDRPLSVGVREARLLGDAPWVRSLGKLTMEVSTEGWRFPTPLDPPPPAKPRLFQPAEQPAKPPNRPPASVTRPKPPSDSVLFKDRLLYLLQPPLENLFAGKQVSLPFEPYPYQIEGIAFLMPRHSALLADEMGLGKTMQTILALRLLFHAGLVRRALLVCPKPLVHNWSRELRTWAPDVPFEVIGGDLQTRRAAWLVSNCPLKLVNYEVLTRDADLLIGAKGQGRETRGQADGVARDKGREAQEAPDSSSLASRPSPSAFASCVPRFDLVVLDEAQRIKNRDSKTAQVVRGIQRQRSWALTGTPIENRPEDLVNLFAFIDPDRIPPDTPARRLPQFTADCILRRTKEDVLTDIPPKTVQDVFLDLSPAQRAAYELAEKEGVVRLNTLGDTITVQHVFELVMRLKQICNFDPLTGQSAKLEQLQADLTEVVESGRKAIVFSQWVEPLEFLAKALASLGVLQFHGRIPARERPGILDRFRTDASVHVILMSYGTGSVGLNLQFCNYVFLFDRWWNPAIEDQAINRAHRIGQKEPVFVRRFVTQGTIEGRIAEVLERKRQVFNELIEQNGSPPALGLTEEEIFGLFDIQARPKRNAA